MSRTPGDPPTISGHLGTISVQDVLGFLATLGPGALEVVSPDGELTLYLDGGDVVGGRVGRGGGAADKESAGSAAPADEELHEAIFRLFSWQPGDFRFYEGRRPPPGVRPVRIEVRSLLLEAARRCDDWSALPSLYADPETRFELRAEPRYDEKISLDLDEWRLLYLVTNQRRLGEIWDDSPLASRLETARTLFGLASARLIQPIGDWSSRLADAVLSASSSSAARPPALPDVAPPTLAPSPAAAQPVSEDDDSALDTQPVVPPPPGHRAADADIGGTLELERGAGGELTRSSRRLTRSQVRVERAARLVQLAPGGDRRVFPLAGDRVTLGRARDNHLILADGHVSGHHARILREGDRFVIVDSRSSNGVRVNGRPVFRAALEGGDEIEIYPYHFRFEVSYEVFESS